MIREFDEQAEVQRGARRWRRLAVLGGLALAASCFMPAIRACNSDIVPARGVVEVADDLALGAGNTGGFSEDVRMLCTFLCPYLAGLLLAAGAVARLCGWQKWNRALAAALLVVVVGTAVALLGLFVYYVAQCGLPDLDEWEQWLIYLVAPTVAAAYLWLARRRVQQPGFRPAFVGSLWMVYWFGQWVATHSSDLRYGIYVSFAGAGLLLAATVGEARALTGQTWRRTLGQLLTARLARSREFRGRCPKCDYLLYGLSEMRCPECGRAFTFEEVGLSREPAPASLGGSAERAL